MAAAVGVVQHDAPGGVRVQRVIAARKDDTIADAELQGKAAGWQAQGRACVLVLTSCLISACGMSYSTGATRAPADSNHLT